MGLLEGKRAFISGGSRGIGKALCSIFAREGADVAFNYNADDEAAADTVATVESYGQKAMAFKVPVTDREGIIKMSAQVIEAYGGVDILVNNAAVNKADSFVTTTEKAWRDIVEVNVNGLYYITKPFFKQMLRQRSGHILNISSIGGIRALPTSVHYATTKAAVIGFTKCLSREAGAFGVSVNGIAAGIYDTALGHSLPEAFNKTYINWCIKGRLGQPQELAEFAAFLVSDRNSYMTGEVVILDGGTMV
ncbi:MAG: SDR family oxidoreductase [Candidatus Melainabacteria bacterium]|nr:SDR family oxidoreductase [Candidatus Melainabacteria bacterium]